MGLGFCGTKTITRAGNFSVMRVGTGGWVESLQDQERPRSLECKLDIIVFIHSVTDFFSSGCFVVVEITNILGNRTK